METKEQIMDEVKRAVDFLFAAGHMEAGMQMVLGCSTSEVVGGHIGKNSVPEVGEWIARAMLDACAAHDIVPIFQCCEHLNRSLVMEKAEAVKRGYTRVMAVPHPKAGGSTPSAAYRMMKEPTLCMAVQAEAGMDIGDTLIGMHLHPVAVPARADFDKIGDAHLVMAYTRLPFVGGERAKYTL